MIVFTKGDNLFIFINRLIAKLSYLLFGYINLYWQSLQTPITGGINNPVYFKVQDHHGFLLIQFNLTMQGCFLNERIFKLIKKIILYVILKLVFPQFKPCKRD